MPAQRFYVGARIICEAEFRVRGVPTDPVTVVCKVRSPSGAATQITYPAASLVRTDLGLYEATVTADVPGTWAIRFEGAGGVEAVNEVVATVIASNVI